MKALTLPRKNSPAERILEAVVVFSPIAVAAHFILRFDNVAAHPSPPCDIGIPMVIYFYLGYPMFFPVFLAIAMYGQPGLNQETRYFLWNPQRDWASFLWTLAACFPGLSVLALLADAVVCMMIPSLIYFLLMGVALLVYRAGGISKKGREKTEAAGVAAAS